MHTYTNTCTHIHIQNDAANGPINHINIRLELHLPQLVNARKVAWRMSAISPAAALQIEEEVQPRRKRDSDPASGGFL